jgi:hypothetical protein
MNMRCARRGVSGARLVILPVLLLVLTGFLAAQATVSAGPLSLYQVKVIYVAPSSDEFASQLKSRLERWEAVRIAAQPEEADAVLTCHTESRIVPAKVVLRWTTAEAVLVDRRSQKLVWKTSKNTSLDTARLAEEIVEQLKKDWRKSAGEF